MKFTKLIPNIFYSDISVGLQLFVNCLQFEIAYNDLKAEDPFCIVKKDNLAIHLLQNHEFAMRDRPEIRIETDDIEEAYETIFKSYPNLLHPNLNKVTERPWKTKEFAMLDESGVCVVIQQPVNQ
jgi:hypothetical protein